MPPPVPLPAKVSSPVSLILIQLHMLLPPQFLPSSTYPTCCPWPSIICQLLCHVLPSLSLALRTLIRVPCFSVTLGLPVGRSKCPSASLIPSASPEQWGFWSWCPLGRHSHGRGEVGVQYLVSLLGPLCPHLLERPIWANWLLPSQTSCHCRPLKPKYRSPLSQGNCELLLFERC